MGLRGLVIKQDGNYTQALANLLLLYMLLIFSVIKYYPGNTNNTKFLIILLTILSQTLYNTFKILP